MTRIGWLRPKKDLVYVFANEASGKWDLTDMTQNNPKLSTQKKCMNLLDPIDLTKFSWLRRLFWIQIVSQTRSQSSDGSKPMISQRLWGAHIAIRELTKSAKVSLPLPRANFERLGALGASGPNHIAIIDGYHRLLVPSDDLIRMVAYQVVPTVVIKPSVA